MRAFIGIILLITSVAFAKGKLQNEDFKTLSELTTAGGTAAQLLNDTKVYVTANGINSQLSSAITNGQLGGSGTGINLLQALNPTFESGITSWTASGGTFTHITTGQLFGLGSGQWTPTAAAQTLQSSLVSFPVGSEGKTCLAVFEYNWNGTLGQITADLVDGSGNVLANMTLTPAAGAGARKSYSAQLNCPVSPTQARIRLTSTAASTAIKIDQAFIGLGFNDVQVSQANLYATVSYASATQAATWNFPGGAGTVAVGDSSLYNDTTKNYTLSGAGQYRIALIWCTSNSIPVNTGIALSVDGAAANVGINNTTWAANAGDSGCRTTEANVSVAAGATRTVRPTVYVASGSIAGVVTVMTIHKFPSSPADAINLETTGWRVDVNIGGTTNPSLGTVAVPNYSEIPDPNLNMVVNAGSLSAQIPCSGSNPSTGLTCAAGNEVFGVVFDAPAATDVLVCAAFNHYANVGAASNVNGVFTIAETPNNSTTILQTNNTRVDSIIQNSGFMGMPHNNCGVMRFATAGKKTLRLMYEQAVAGTVSISQIIADRNPAAGDRDVHITVIPLTNQFPTPVFTDLQNSMNSKPTVVNRNGLYNDAAGFISATGTINGQTGNISSVVKNGTGDFSVNFTTGFNTNAFCNVNPVSSPSVFAHIISSGSNQLRYQLRNDTGAATDFAAQFRCLGN